MSVKRSDVREQRDKDGVSDAEVWLIEHSRLELPAVLRRRERAEGEAEDVGERVRRVRGLWRHATRLVLEQLQRDKEDALQQTYTIGGQPAAPSAQSVPAQWNPGPIATEDLQQQVHVFRLPKRSKGGLASKSAASSRPSSAALAPVSAARVPTSPRAVHRVSVGRRPSMSLSSSIAPISSVLSDVSVLSSASPSVSSPLSPRSQSSHFVIPAAAQRYSRQPYYAPHKRRGDQ